VPSDEPDEIRAIWGTTVNLAETMKLFRDFLRGFKPKYRALHDRQEGLRARTFATPEDGEIVLYETYMRRIRQTGETNLNLDMVNLLSYPPSKKLFSQLQKYPQEVVPAMDQVLKDIMLELADEDQQAGMDGMQGDQGDEEIADIMGKVYKVRPFGLTAMNMRDLNPSGMLSTSQTSSMVLTYYRYGQTHLYKGSSHSRNACNPRHESRLLPLPHVLSYRPSRNRPR
jgi:DNA replication licensing factor MCM4